jgi:hypothetical protein
MEAGGVRIFREFVENGDESARLSESFPVRSVPEP